MKRLTTFAMIAGLLIATGLVVSSGLEEVGAAVLSAGWGVLAVVAARAAVVAWAGLGWYALMPREGRLPLRDFVALRFVREGVNTLLPVAQVGGDLVGARLMVQRGVRGGLAGASVIVDVMAQAVTQFLFTVMGLGALMWLGGDAAIARYVALGLALAAPALVAFYWVQRRSGHRLVHAVLARFAGEREWRAIGAVEVLYDQLRGLYGRRRQIALSLTVHLAGWLVGTLEVWVALAFMGHPVTLLEALVIESLAQAVRGAAFAVPGALGAQEGGLVALCAIFGVPPGPALALSLVKRVADLACGVPGLLAWQAMEGRRLTGGGQPVVEIGSRTGLRRALSAKAVTNAAIKAAVPAERAA